MSSSAMPRPQPFAIDVSFTDDEMIVSLTDGRKLSVPLEWFPRLRDASPEARNKWRLVGSGIGINREALDEDISIPALLTAWAWGHAFGCTGTEPRKIRASRTASSLVGTHPC